MKLLKAQTLQILAFASVGNTAPAPQAPDSSGVGNRPNWPQVTCTDPGSTNAALDPATRWFDVDADRAWLAVVGSLNEEGFSGGTGSLSFPEVVSNFFHGPEQWNCQDIGNTACSTTIECSQTNHPAG
jgi:hypothetical protein